MLSRLVQEGHIDSESRYDLIEEREKVLARLRLQSTLDVQQVQSTLQSRRQELERARQLEKQQAKSFKLDLLSKFAGLPRSSPEAEIADTAQPENPKSVPTSTGADDSSSPASPQKTGLQGLALYTRKGQALASETRLLINDQAEDIQNLMSLKLKGVFNSSFGEKDLGLMGNEELTARLMWKN